MNFAFRRSLGSPFTFKAGQARASLLLALGVLLAGSAASAAPARSTADDGKGAPAEETSTSRPATSTQPASSPANLVTGKGVLPIEGASALASELHLSLGQALRKQKLDQVTGPTDVQARLQKAPRVGETVDEASKLLGEASQASLYMKRGDAVRLSRQAIAKLQSVSGRFHAPRLLARANGELALSLLLKPADEAGAKEAFKKAVQAYPAYKPDKDRTHPAALKLLAAARAGWKPMAPKLADFAELSRLCQIEDAGLGGGRAGQRQRQPRHADRDGLLGKQKDDARPSGQKSPAQRAGHARRDAGTARDLRGRVAPKNRPQKARAPSARPGTKNGGFGPSRAPLSLAASPPLSW
jgi:hypothetical protein